MALGRRRMRIEYGSRYQGLETYIEIGSYADCTHLQEAARKYANIQVITAYMGEMYGEDFSMAGSEPILTLASSGTHHSKMIILSRHDDQAEVIIVTGNFILRDWSMCQAVWRSGLLPLLTASLEPRDHSEAFPIGSGARFKEDILAYLRAYGSKRTGALTAELDKYDFCSIRAALIASVPGKQKVRSIDPETETLWGWPRVRQILSSIGSISEGARPRIVMQCSSVASLNENWVGNFKTALAVTKGSITSRPNKTPNVSLIFPTADEIRRSVDGYASGGSIHMKTQSAAQIKQLAHLRPMLCHWAGDADSNLASVNGPDKFPVRQALRRRAAPHIKTYIRFSDEEMKRIDWAMMTSANLSKQAWGEAITTGGEVRICSYEIGVVVWPALWDEGGGAEMVPVFGKDMPEYGGGGKANVDDNNEWQPARTEQKEDDDEETTDEEGGKGLREQKTKEPAKRKIIVGLRMPYDLPVVPYRQDEMPWCASMPCAEPDWMGRTWPAFDNS